MGPLHAISDLPSTTTGSTLDAITMIMISGVGLLAGVVIGLALGRHGRSGTNDGLDELLELADVPDLGFAGFDANLVATRWNPGMDRLLAEIADSDGGSERIKEWWSAIHPDDRPRLRTTLRGLQPNQSTSCDFRVRRDHGRWWSMRGTIRRSRNGTSALLFHDDSDRASIERRRESSARLRRTLEIAVETLDGTEDLDQAMCELLALIGEELDLPGIGWFEVDPESRSRRIASWPAGRSADTAMSMPATLSSGTISRLEAGRSIHERNEATDRFMSPIRVDSHLDSILVADFEPDEERTDEIVLVFGRFCDAIGRRFEREELGRERESFATIRGSLERSEILLQLAGGLRHDFNNVAFAIGGRVSLLLQRTDDPVTAKGLEEIRNAVDAAQHLIDRFVPDAAGAPRTLRIPIRVELEEIANTAKRLIPRRLDLRFECDRSAIDDGVVLEAPPETLQRMLLNLVVNSRDAIRGRGRIRISARRLDADRIEIRVDDDGPGIPPSDRARLLEPFESGPGSTGPGVGLSLCRRSANRLGGLFELTSSPLGGLGARLVLPVCVESPGRLDETPAAAVGDARMPRTTLVVEDNAAVRDVITTHLEQAGTSVTKASDAVGVEEYLAADHDIEMLVMDIDLPRRSGIDCISALRAAGDRTPCVLITGGVADPPPLERTRLLRKPFEMGPLVSTIRDLLADCESATADAGRRTG